MNVQSQDRMKMAVLIGAIAVVFFLIARTVASEFGGKSKPVAAANQASGKGAAPASAPIRKPAAEDRVAFLAPPMSSIDPFRTVVAQTPVEEIRVQAPPPPIARGPEPNWGNEPVRPVSPEFEIRPSASERFKLEGVVLAERNLAVLTAGGSPWFVSPGDALPGGWRLSKVDPEGMTIRLGELTRRVRVGESWPGPAAGVARELPTQPILADSGVTMLAAEPPTIPAIPMDAVINEAGEIVRMGPGRYGDIDDDPDEPERIR
jgi:hypothetical protein